jgi:hypothetical protein
MANFIRSERRQRKPTFGDMLKESAARALGGMVSEVPMTFLREGGQALRDKWDFERKNNDIKKQYEDTGTVIKHYLDSKDGINWKEDTPQGPSNPIGPDTAMPDKTKMMAAEILGSEKPKKETEEPFVAGPRPPVDVAAMKMGEPIEEPRYIDWEPSETGNGMSGTYSVVPRPEDVERDPFGKLFAKPKLPPVPSGISPEPKDRGSDKSDLKRFDKMFREDQAATKDPLSEAASAMSETTTKEKVAGPSEDPFRDILLDNARESSAAVKNMNRQGSILGDRATEEGEAGKKYTNAWEDIARFRNKGIDPRSVIQAMRESENRADALQGRATGYASGANALYNPTGSDYQGALLGSQERQNKYRVDHRKRGGTYSGPHPAGLTPEEMDTVASSIENYNTVKASKGGNEQDPEVIAAKAAKDDTVRFYANKSHQKPELLESVAGKGGGKNRYDKRETEDKLKENARELALARKEEAAALGYVGREADRYWRVYNHVDNAHDEDQLGAKTKRYRTQKEVDDEVDRLMKAGKDYAEQQTNGGE